MEAYSHKTQKPHRILLGRTLVRALHGEPLICKLIGFVFCSLPSEQEHHKYKYQYNTMQIIFIFGV